MKKVKLDADRLVVETFSAGDSPAGDRGTVQAYADVLAQATIANTCSHEIACYYTRGC